MYKFILSLAFFLAVNHAFNAGNCISQLLQSNGSYGGAVQYSAASVTKIHSGNSVSIFLSTNKGTNWTAVNSPLTAANVRSLIISGADLFSGTENGGAFSSSDTGANRTDAGSDLKSTVVYFHAPAANMISGTGGGGVFLSGNGVTNWTVVSTGMTSTSIRAFAVSSTNQQEETRHGVFLFAGNGTNRMHAGSGLTNNYIISLAVSGLNLITEIRSSGALKQSVPGLIAAARLSSGEPEGRFYPMTNYPNLFNPMTNVKFQMINSGNAKINVFDLLGREVVTLVNEKLQSGFYEVLLDGSGLNSGVYFYRLTTDDFSDIRKILVLK